MSASCHITRRADIPEVLHSLEKELESASPVSFLICEELLTHLLRNGDREILERVGLDDLLKTLPDGLNSRIREDGGNLSGGDSVSGSPLPGHFYGMPGLSCSMKRPVRWTRKAKSRSRQQSMRR